MARAGFGLLALAAWTGLATAAGAVDLKLELTGDPSVVYDPAHAACTPNDIPDMNPRAFRDAAGTVVMFALHFTARPLRGPDLAHLKPDCHVALDSPLDPDPAHFADRYYVAATWTANGRDVGALVHEEYHADEHGRCRATTSLGCWYNTVLGFHSADGGLSFARSRPAIVAAAPFRQDVGQGRHRGFFEPSNMVGSGGYVYAFVSTTGWDGQDAGSCLFRTADPTRSGSWRAYDGHGFTIRYGDPYQGSPKPAPCAVINPFTFAVGSLTRHQRSGLWLAVYQAAEGGPFPVSGFYYAVSKDLLHWSPARLLLGGRTLYDDPCRGGPSLINYPSVLDPASPARNFDTMGDRPALFYTAMTVKDCQTGERLLLRQGLTVTTVPGEP